MTLYKKIGKKYIPEREYYESMDSLPKGFHLIMVEPGLRSIRFDVIPDYAGLLAAARKMEDAMIDAMRAEEAMRPIKSPITLKQQAAWKHFSKVMGDNVYTFQRASVKTVVEAGINVLIKSK